MPNAYVAALLRERDGYKSRNLPDRVAEVDAELAKSGYRTAEAKPPAAPAPPKTQADPKTETPPPPPSKPEPQTASLEATETAAIPRGRPRRSEPNG